MSYTWLTFKNAVKSLMSDQTINDDTAVLAIADFVRARVAKDLAGDGNGFNANWAAYQYARKNLLGYTVTLDQATLRSRVRELLTDSTINDTVGARAVADFVRAKLAWTYDNDNAAHDAFLNSFNALKRRLLGYTIGLSSTALKTEVVNNISDVEPTDDSYCRAVADYVKAVAARDLTNNGDAFNANMGSYRLGRKKLLGYTTALSDAQVKAKVKQLITDADLTDTTAVLAIYEFVKSRIAQTVDKNVQSAELHNSRWMVLRNRLLGYTIVSNAAALRTELNKLLTVDANRAGIAETGGFIDTLIAQAVSEIEALDTFIDTQCLQAKADLIAINDFLDEQITQATTEIAGVNTFLNTIIDQGKTDLAGSATQIDRFILHGVREIQHYIEFYRANHETVYQPVDVADDGEASVGQLPEGAMPRDAYYVTVGNPCKRMPMDNYPWGNRFDLVCGAPTMPGNRFWLAIDPNGKTFTAYPPILDGNYLSLFWDGIKTEFSDADSVPFDDVVVKAVANYVQSEMYRQPGPNRDLKAAEIYNASWEATRRQAFRDSRDKVSLRQTQGSPLGSTPCAMGETVDDTLVEFVLYGDSGEEPMDNTLAVANLMKQLDPDFFIHLGDTNYPSGEPEAYYDHYQRVFSSWIDSGNLYQVWGNHDLMHEEDGQYGKPLLNLLPHISELSGGKLYYKFSKGGLNFFVYNSGYADNEPREPDGINSVSTQAEWLQAALAESTSGINIVLMHRPPWSSDVFYTPGSAILQALPLKTWGAHVVISGHSHNYERLLVDGLPFVVCGLGGGTKRNFGATAPGSQFRYTDNYGCIKASGTSTSLKLVFYDINKTPVDSITINVEG